MVKSHWTYKAKKFECAKIEPIAFINREQFIIPIVENNYILHNENSAFLMSREKMKNCIKGEEKNYSEFDEPFYTKYQTTACEYELYINKTKPYCKFAKAPQEQWKELSINRWLYHLSKKQKLSIICSEQSDEIFLDGSGILELSKDSRRKVTSNAERNGITTYHEIKMPGESHINLHIDVEKTLENLKKTYATLFWHNIHHYFLIYATLAATIITKVVYFYQKLKLAPEI